MMEKVLCLIQGYLKQSEANAICLKAVLNEFEAVGVCADVITIEANPGEAEMKNVYTVIENCGLLKLTLLKKVLKAFTMPIGNYGLIKRIKNIACELLNKNEYKAVIAVVNPVETAEALKQLKKQFPLLNTILYEIDPASNRYKKPCNLFEKVWSLRAEQWEKSVYSWVDHIIHMKTHKAHFSRNAYSPFCFKTSYLDIPSFAPVFLLAAPKKRDNYRFLYAGAFYPNLRNPMPMLRLLRAIAKKEKIVVDIYTGARMHKELLAFSATSGGAIRIHDYISQEDLAKEYAECDALLDLANSNSDFLSSKTLQYIGTGKPIIHFFSDGNDVSLPYLEKYSNALLLDLKRDWTVLTDELLTFIKKAKRLGEKDVLALESDYFENTPLYTANKLLEML